ncbi:DUF4157 domain-containing protein [Stenotrophomonas sp. HITSZ_GD]|uniref:eCIS core domain-containing protein n=1 Tax=Stenotrophomonas sp. HITSZ_GD TaxID=3037248 RepID=UPI00240D041A|nr:DUF4157 domain-containing protein [Stenotrophomonas sp. HITSZ_GD]MDG2524155.1 DUF4157 domain-containing protein [Stenotrophomonas sp. HITSZ_GD]
MSEPARQLDSTLVRPPEAAAASRCACGNHTLGESRCAACAAQNTLALGAMDDPREHEADRFADAYAAGGGHGAALPPAGPSASAPLRIAPPPSLARSLDTPGHPLDAELRQDMEARLGTPLGHVRVHHDSLAAQATRDLDAQAYTLGAHVAFGEGRYAPHRDEGRQLIAHELAHVAQDRGSAPVLRRKPKAGAAAAPKKEGDKQDDNGPDWTRLQIHAAGMDDAAAFMATHQLNFRHQELRQRIYVGLHPKFLKVYDGTGKAIGGKLNFKKVPGLKFTPGIYVHVGAAMRAITIDRAEEHIDVEPTNSAVVSRDLTAEERKQANEDAKKEGAAAAPKALPIMDLTSILEDPGAFRQRATSVMNPLVIYFVPTYPSSGGSANGAGGKGMYASPVEGRPDGQPPNAPPWPVSVTGPKLVPVNANPTYSATIDWGANGNYSVMSQAISQVGETIHYRWESFDITRYAEEQAAKETAEARGEKVDESGMSYEARLERLKSSAVGSGKDVTGMGGANHEFKRAFGDWLDDTRRAARGTRNPQGDTTGERFSNLAANRLALEMTPASLLITTLGAIAGWVADLFAGPRQQQEVPLKKKGIYLVRAITTPAVHEDTHGQPIIRPPSVASRITEVAPMETAVDEALDEPGAQLAELQAQIDLADKEGAPGKAAYLRELLRQAKLRFEGSALDVLKASRADKQKELDELHAKAPQLPDYDLTRDIGLIDDQIARYNRHEADRTEGAAGLAPMQRLNATLISEVTGEQYPLLLSAGPMAMSGDQYRWLVSDVTNRDGDSYIGMGGTPSAALRSALTKFGGRAAYGRGRIGVRTGNLALEANADKTILVESAPANWALAEKRLDDLVMTLAAVGLFVASAGTASAAIGAAVAGARLIERWRAGRLYLDAQTVGDVLGVLGGVGMAGQLAAGLRVQKFEKIFAILQDGKFTQAQFDAVTKAINGAQKLARGVELANEVLNYGGLIWGNITFIDQMVDIAAQERSGAMTHAAARRARAQAISSAVQNNGMFIAGNVMKAKQAQKESAAQEKAAAAKPPAATEPLPKADGTAHPGEVVGGDPLATPERPLAEREQAKRTDAEEKAAPQADTAGPGTKPAAERTATVEELARELPPEMQKLLKIDPALEGDDVRVDYTLDEQGLIKDIQIRCSAEARPETVGQHADTVAAMRKYQGFSGRVRLAIADIGRLIGFDTIKPEHAASYQAMLEVQKLPKVIKAQLDRIATLDPKAAGEANAELAKLQTQLDQHLRTLDLGTAFAGEGEGFVAAKGLSKAKQRQYAELETKLRQNDPGTDRHKAIRREMYELIGGDLPYESWERVYQSNVMRARKANAIVAAEHERLGWGKTEQTVRISDTEVRRLDIADVKKKVGIEIKAYETEEIYASRDMVSEVERDAKLVKRGWKIKWVLIDTEPSGPLLKLLLDNGILVERRSKDGSGGTTFVSRNLPRR